MSDLQQTLRDLHRELADAPRLDPAERAMLESAVADIQATLAQQATRDEDDTTASPADALEGAAVRLEADHPSLAGAVRAFVDALAKAGI
jgi:Domain of unknown function (DUF4404)